jgi:succinate dehydrogenase/fumarate reductase-like Fe-S protein
VEDLKASPSRIIVTRGDPASGPRDDTYEVLCEPGVSILDALIWVRSHLDPTLAVRYSCRANACKECSAVIDGKAGYLCSVRIKESGISAVAPLTKRRWLRDLVSELD